MHRVIEVLEARIAPAAVFTYTEADGDKVTVKTSAKVSAEYFESLASFNGDNLSELLLNDPVFQNTNLTITVKKAGGGDGKASIGHIQANVDLKNVIINGDLGSMSAGDSNRITAPINKLQVQNFGRDDDSYFLGNVKEIRILGDLIGDINADGISAISIAGSIRGDADLEAYRIGSLVVGDDMAGQIYVSTAINSVRIGGNILSEFGENGTIYADTIKSISIGGSILGSGNDGSRISAQTIGKLVVDGNMIGGSASTSGSVSANKIGSVIVKGNVTGGSGYSSGQISGYMIGSIRIDGDLEGGSEEYSGRISADEGGSADKIVIGGSVIGGSGYASGVVAVSDIGSAVIGKSIVGGDGEYSGAVQSRFIQSIRVAKDVIGGSSQYSGVIRSYDGIGLLRIGGDLQGGSGNQSGWVDVSEGGSIEKVVIGGSIKGHTGYLSGSIVTDGIGSASIGGSILGGSGEYSGNVQAGSIGSVRVAKDVIGSTGEASGRIFGHGGITSVYIGKDLIGDGPFSGTIESSGGAIGAIVIGGSLSNTGDQPTGIYARGSIGSVTIGGGVTGFAYGSLGIYAGSHHPANSSVPAIGSVKIKGNVTNLLISAGTYGLPSVATASIGSVSIGGEFKTSSIAAGVGAGADGIFGTTDDVIPANDPNVVSRIASVMIGKSAVGSPDAPSDGYGIIAQHIVELKVKGVKQTLQAGAANDLVAALLSGTDDVRYVEAPLVVET